MNRQEANETLYANLEKMDLREMGIEADEIAEAVEVLKAPDWISVKDRLPDDDEPVLVTYVGYVDTLPHNDAIALYAHEITDNYAGAWYWQDSDGVDDNPVSVSITHWMPLPEPPKGEEFPHNRYYSGDGVASDRTEGPEPGGERER